MSSAAGPSSDTVFLIPAAGSSTRFSPEKKKEYLFIAGRSLLGWILQACRESGVVRRVLIVHAPGAESQVKNAVSGEKEGLELLFTAGGDTRQDSVRLGLEHLAVLDTPPSYVLIHDGARPWVSPGCIQRVLQACKIHGGAAPVITIPDALKGINKSHCIIEHYDRDGTFGVQTPQGFEFTGILKAHRSAQYQQKPYIDDTEVYCDSGGTVMAVPGERKNRKITYQSDLAVDAPPLHGSVVIGHGWDCHRLVPGRKLMIGGVTIPSEKGEDGHSDGDVLLHAVIDALFGAASLGDIGSHFPPGDPQWKDADSSFLLSCACGKLRDIGFQTVHVDATVILEEPKLRPYIDQIRNTVAGSLSLPVSSVSVKAKTAEGIPPVGTGEAVEAVAVATVVPVCGHGPNQ